MRIILYSVSLLALTLSAHAFADDTQVVSTCDDTLKERMKASANRQADCEVTITNGEDSVTKTYRAKLVGNSASEAQLALQEFCETCGTEGPTQKYAIRWNELTDKILANLESEVNGAETAPAKSVTVGSCDGRGSKKEIASCHLAILNKATEGDEATLYYQTNIEPLMQRLAQSKNEDDRLLLRQIILTFYTNVHGGAVRSRSLVESVEQFNHFVSFRESLAQISRDRQMAGNFPPALRANDIQRLNALGQAEAYFRNRAMLLRQMNVNDPKLLRNAELLLATLKQGGDGASPAATGTDINGRPRGQTAPGADVNGRPRGMYGTPGGMVNGGIAPRQVTGGSPFHAN